MTVDADDLREEPAEPVEDPDAEVERRPYACALGTAWETCGAVPCPACQAETDRWLAAFQARVAAGEMDRLGYEPGDRGYGGQDRLF